jgi:pimeloyl-ACP methyl ester carboxylesterase
LKRKYRCLIYDTRGVGRSQPISPDAGLEIDEHADDLKSIVESVGIFDATLIGHEMGALVAAVCAERHPRRQAPWFWSALDRQSQTVT